jgi:hypothetical protein
LHWHFNYSYTSPLNGRALAFSRRFAVGAWPDWNGITNLPASATAVIASTTLAAAAAWMPWATFRGEAHNVTIRFSGGSLTDFILFPAIGVILFSLATMRWPVRSVQLVRLILAGVTLALVVVLALRSISSANSVSQVGYSVTSWSIGSVIGVVAGVIMFASSAVGFAQATKTFNG